MAGVCDYLDAVYDHHFTGQGNAVQGDARQGESGGEDPAERCRRLGVLFRHHETRLLARLLEFLRDRDDLRILGPDDPDLRAPTVAIQPLERDAFEVQRRLTEQRVMAGVGHFYGVRPLDGMRVPTDPGVLRVSFVHYTTEEEIDQLLAGLEIALGSA